MDTSNSAHGAAAASSSSSSGRSICWKYEVFLSFRGEDTRKTFIDHLFIALRKAGINTFMDNQLTRGENIQRQLYQKIEGSRIAVIVFSKKYAESRWCLRELSKIMRCRKDQKGKIVYPIFYDVNPSEVRIQSGSFEEAFRKHESDQDPNEVKQWRKNLKDSADLAGWNLETTADGREGVFIEIIVGDIKGLLTTTNLNKAKHSVGMAFPVLKGSPDVQIIGIRGTGGIGKTKVNKTKVDLAKWDICHILLCYKTPEAWPWCINGSKSDPLPKFFTSALKACKNNITFKMSMTVIEGHEGTKFSNDDVLIFPQMIKYRGLKESDLDSFVDDVLVNHKPWASGVQEQLTGPYVFICAQMRQDEWYRYHARSLINEFKQEAKLRGLTDRVYVTACFHIGGHMCTGNLIIYSISSDGSIKYDWCPFATPGAVPELLDKHIGKGEIIERHWRGQIGASSDEVEEINDRELPNGEENKKNRGSATRK